MFTPRTSRQAEAAYLKALDAHQRLKTNDSMERYLEATRLWVAIVTGRTA